MMCEICREHGIAGRESYAHRLTDGQRLALCVGHARAWRMRDRAWYPVPYGKDAKAAHARWEDDHPAITARPNRT